MVLSLSVKRSRLAGLNDPIKHQFSAAVRFADLSQTQFDAHFRKRTVVPAHRATFRTLLELPIFSGVVDAKGMQSHFLCA